MIFIIGMTILGIICVMIAAEGNSNNFGVTAIAAVCLFILGVYCATLLGRIEQLQKKAFPKPVATVLQNTDGTTFTKEIVNDDE